ncbi:MAG TPA: AAA family ATPase [Gemmatimonadaceae bacterium]|nr:AAA family ATPase [Gemmatimonadaceae bacterium]
MIDEPPRATGALARYTRDLTADARAGRLEPVCGRQDEIARVIDILLRHGKSNPALVGAAGVGKTAVAEGLAQRIAEGTVPFALRDVRLLSLDHVSLLAGTTYRGQYEERIRALVSETQASPDVILFVDELHNLIGQGTGEGAAMDAANMLKPALARGDFRVIGATTDAEYDRWVLGDSALERRFQKVPVRELSDQETLDVLQARRERLERHHNVLIGDDALEAAVALTDRHVRDRRRPDKAIDALDEACAHLQAVTIYAPGTEALLRARRSAARSAPRRGPAPASRTPEESDDLARASFDVLDRFGAAIEAALAEADAFERPAPPRPAPVTATPAPDGAALDAEIAQHLRDEGIIVRGADVARVVALMSGGSVTWE